MKSDNIEDIYPLSPMQQGMLFHSIYSPEAGEYIEQMSCRLIGVLDVQAFERAWQDIIDRHPILRTAFVWEGLDEPMQVVHQTITFKAGIQDWRNLAREDHELRLEEFLESERKSGFVLAAAPLMRIALFQTTDATYQFVWTCHHLIIDGWSLPLLMEDFFAHYEALAQHKSFQARHVHPYRDYIAWLQQQDQTEAEQFWRDRLKDFASPTMLQIERATKFSAEDQDYRIETIFLSEQLSKDLLSLTRQYQLTMNTLVQGAWSLLLSHYIGSQDVIFGATVSGRPPELVGSEFMIGLFINTLPGRVKISPDMPLHVWLKELQQQQSEMRQFEYSSLAQIQGYSEIPRDIPLFDSILVFENYPISQVLTEQNSSLKIENIRAYSRTNYPITLVISPGDQFRLEIAYDCHRFESSMISQIFHHLQKLLTDFTTHPEQAVANFVILSNDEKKKILVDWNQTAADNSLHRCIHQLFEDQVSKTPDQIAVIFEDEKLTYRELNRRANRLAYELMKIGAGPEVRVGICMDRSFEMIIGLLAILKAGAAYLPLDPVYPEERLAFMLNDAGATILLSQKNLTSKFDNANIKIICFDSDEAKTASKHDQNPVSGVFADNLAYVIYTSGSTGVPKGTMISHSGLVNHALALVDHGKLSKDDRILQLISLSFDASAEEIFPTLICGATLVLHHAPLELPVEELFNLCQEQQITTLHLPVALWHQIVEEVKSKQIAIPQTLRSVIIGGESPSLPRVKDWSKLVNGSVKLTNVYGPTEATISTTLFDVPASTEAVSRFNRLPIGRPLNNIQTYILNEKLQPVPAGVAGELYIGGINLARGYLNRPEMTAEKFIPHPFSQTPGTHLYRTGDRAYYLSDGNIVFAGRTDHQIKLRGYRIELEEIEQVLRQHPAVDEAILMIKSNNQRADDRYLVAYFVTNDQFDSQIGANELSLFLKSKLPEYMVPSLFIKLDKLPLTHTGKINRQALPEPDIDQFGLKQTYVAPRNPTEDILVSLFKQILGRDQVGIHDNFFHLGGHSLLATRLLSQIRETFQIELELRSIFETPNVADLARKVERSRLTAKGLTILPLTPVSRDQELPLSFAQQRLWFLDQLEPGKSFYNIPTALRLKGRLNVRAFEQSINEIIRRHEILRTTFSSEEGKPYPVIAPKLFLLPEKIDLSETPTDEKEKMALELAKQDAERPFDLSNGPLLRVTLIKLGEEDHIVLFTMHHIISDGWSVALLVNELVTLYHAFAQGDNSPLPPLPVQYVDFAYWQRQWLSGEILNQQLSYWRKQLKDIPPLLELPTDRPRPAVQSFHGNTLSEILSAELTASLQQLSQQEDATLFMTLLAAFQALLYRYSGQTDIPVGTPIANRTRIETEQLIGFFVNTLVLRTQLSGNWSFRKLLTTIKQTALEAYAHQDIPFEMLVEELQPQRNLSHSPLFQVMFVLQNAPMQDLALADLTVSPVEADTGTSKFDLSLIIIETPDGLRASFEYNTDLFNAATIDRMMNHFKNLLNSIATNPDQQLSQLPILTDAERRQMLVDWNETAAEYPRNRCVHEEFEALVTQYPEAVAVTFNETQLNYRELNERSNQMAHYLTSVGIGTETRVGIFMQRSIDMVVALMATLKAGGAFLPLDPAYPAERLEYMIEDSNIAVLLSQQSLVERLPELKTKMVLMDVEWENISQQFSRKNLKTTVFPDNLAYVIYTSGSTGKPKGTALNHTGLCNLARAQQRAFDVKVNSRILQFSALSFDATVWETVMALLNGATLCLTSQESIASGQGLIKILEEQKITTVTLPPSMVTVMPATQLPDLQVMITAGEKCTPDIVSRWTEGRKFFNAYGPTETTVCAAMMHVTHQYDQGPPIGKPIQNFQLYVLDSYLNPVPIGVPGELYIAGVGLARGYWKQPDLTAEKFIPNPFSKTPGSRLYRSGDRVRYLPDGNIEFLGRIDHQVKVRGFRIELGEIEVVLSDHPNVREVAVIVREDIPDDRRIVAYIVSEPGMEINTIELRRYLRDRLPEYMVPTVFMKLDKLPLTPSGKLDRKSLPAPDQIRPELETAYVAPRNEIEQKLVQICCELLYIKKVGIYDNFFDLGGHSLLATQFMSRVRTAFHIELPLRALFEKPTIAELSEVIQKTIAEVDTLPIIQVPDIKRYSRESHRARRSQLDKVTY